ncbi:hypothetical protein RJ639_000825 [Escallonia herrerae]|uniref:Kelch repeat-containing protein n=1 Tax=Escallonia herrerae TaxID=1293975 RepID=A0AA89BN44_9ASTE|nr:hypothetical protein RJ639_000825 [Escallonia herrerae]
MSGKFSSRRRSSCRGSPPTRPCSGSGVGGKVVLICGRPEKCFYKFNRLIWYTLTLDGESTEEKGKRGVLGEESTITTTRQKKSSAIWKTRIIPDESSIAVIGTGVYCMGGHCHDSAPTDEVHFGDLLRADEGRHQAPPWARMNRPRMSATSVTVDHKIYTFGCIPRELNPGDSWAEVFDPDLAQWFPLPPPPHILPFVGVFAVKFDDSSRRILVGSQRSSALFIYSIWEQLDVNFPLGISTLSSSIISNDEHENMIPSATRRSERLRGPPNDPFAAEFVGKQWNRTNEKGSSTVSSNEQNANGITVMLGSSKTMDVKDIRLENLSNTSSDSDEGLYMGNTELQACISDLRKENCELKDQMECIIRLLQNPNLEQHKQSELHEKMTEMNARESNNIT